jgi:ABC-type transport system involved in multi-copper enzyme maturation permease subunit
LKTFLRLLKLHLYFNFKSYKNLLMLSSYSIFSLFFFLSVDYNINLIGINDIISDYLQFSTFILCFFITIFSTDSFKYEIETDFSLILFTFPINRNRYFQTKIISIIILISPYFLINLIYISLLYYIYNYIPLAILLTTLQLGIISIIVLCFFIALSSFFTIYLKNSSISLSFIMFFITLNYLLQFILINWMNPNLPSPINFYNPYSIFFPYIVFIILNHQIRTQMNIDLYLLLPTVIFTIILLFSSQMKYRRYEK